MPPSLYDVMSQRDWKKMHFGTDALNTACIAGALAVQEYGSISGYLSVPSAFTSRGSKYLRNLRKLGEVAARLFPERINGISGYKAVNFNNHPETTVDQVLKVCAEYDREVEADA